MTGKQAYYFVKDHKMTVAIATIVLILAVVLLFWLLFGDGQNNTEREIQSNIDQQKGVNAVLVNEAKELNKDVINKAENTNHAINDLLNSINKPSGQFDGNRAADRFCADFPTDPSCPPR